MSKPKAGTKLQVTTPTHISGVIDFGSGVIGTITTSFDAFGGTSLPPGLNLCLWNCSLLGISRLLSSLV
ncbi:hypothetical protein J2S10_004344 [Neobacillus ginsengisoli]|uniref:Uncharacterized protein n=1 Tax=Neobacillus ginsengisoli TaxID=904295 RepID=A0ABT9XZY5_9BACI|nr:hypothetical protein [Neobacillus ginsengisoli]